MTYFYRNVSSFSEVNGAVVVFVFLSVVHVSGLPGGSDSKESAYNSGDPCSINGLQRSSGGGNGNPLQYSCH